MPQKGYPKILGEKIQNPIAIYFEGPLEENVLP